MERRHRMELAKHGYRAGEDPGPDACHCARGKGTMRKMRPYDCGRPGCNLCHPSKNKWDNRRAVQGREWRRYEGTA